MDRIERSQQKYIGSLIIVAVLAAACAAGPAGPGPTPTSVLAEPGAPTATATRHTTPTVPPSPSAPTSPPATAVPTTVLTVMPTVAQTAPQTAAPTVAATIAPQPERALQDKGSMKIRLRVEDKTITATLNESKAAQDFASLLPLTLTLQDYNGTEKISDLPKRLSTEGAPAGSDPSVGDIAYYAPWGNLALYYRDFGYSNGLVILGKIDGGMDLLDLPGSVSVTIERVE